MRYCAYENWHRSRARIHCEGCGHVASARVSEGDIGEHDRWHDLGELDTPEEAMTEARRRFASHYSDAAFCGHCLA